MALLHWNPRNGWRVGLEERDTPWPPPPPPLGLVRLPDFIEQLHHLIIDDEDDGHVQADPAQSGNGALVESGRAEGLR